MEQLAIWPESHPNLAKVQEQLDLHMKKYTTLLKADEPLKKLKVIRIKIRELQERLNQNEIAV